MTPVASAGRGLQRLIDGDPTAWAVLIAAVVLGWVVVPLACRQWGRNRSQRHGGAAEPSAGADTGRHAGQDGGTLPGAARAGDLGVRPPEARQMEEVGRNEVTGRPLFVLDAARPDDIPAALPVPGPYFVCLLAWDSRQASAAEVGAVADRLLGAGCVYAVCWGPDCERVHDAFDAADLARMPDGPWAMTTWHSDEPMSEAIWLALFAAWPDDAFADGCRSVVGVSVGSPAWAAELRSAFAAPSAFSARVLGRG